MTAIYTCPCCNRSIYHKPPCRKFEGRRGSAFGWITLALIGLPVAAITYMLTGCATHHETQASRDYLNCVYDREYVDGLTHEQALARCAR